jgi:SAM-dependent methyltransferase
MSAPEAGTVFGDPYERALRSASGSLVLYDVDHSRAVALDVPRYLSEPDEVDADVARHLPGPVLDIGCGPGRMLRAALDVGHTALGVDVSHTAVHIARRRGLPVVRQSVFDALPSEGEWGSALLLDGNIGIGGDPAALVSRCAGLLRSSGRLVVETHPAPRRDHRFRGSLRDDDGAPGAPFAWAEVGRIALRTHARAAGLELVREWRSGSRRFSEYARPVESVGVSVGIAG